MKIGIVCYPTYGGSGVVATELGRFLALAGHQVHFISSSIPFRLVHDSPADIFFHEVQTTDYPVLNGNLYGIALASKIVQVIQDFGLDIVHCHYAIPHAISAFMAREVLGRPADHTRVVTTLHGTDITLVGKHPSFYPMARYAIEYSDAVTTVSSWLKEETVREFHVRQPINVIPNFVDVTKFRKGLTPCKRGTYAKSGEKILLHISNFRPVKRINDVVEVFARVSRKIPAVLLMIGDGPDRDGAGVRARELGIQDRVRFLGKQEAIELFFSCADLFLFPSEYESFGLAALEAMACEIPVVASNGGGLREVIDNGRTGFTAAVGDVDQMAELALKLLQDRELSHRITQAALAEVHSKYLPHQVVPMYEALYERVLRGSSPVAPRSESYQPAFQYAEGI